MIRALAIAILLTAPASAQTFSVSPNWFSQRCAKAPNDEFCTKWYGRIAWLPQDGIASYYCCDVLDARGKRYDPSKISCAMRVERMDTVVVVTNLLNMRKIDCPVQDRGPYVAARVIDLSSAANDALECNGLCPVKVRRKGFEGE